MLQKVALGLVEKVLEFTNRKAKGGGWRTKVAGNWEPRITIAD